MIHDDTTMHFITAIPWLDKEFSRQLCGFLSLDVFSKHSGLLKGGRRTFQSTQFLAGKDV